MNYSNPKQGYPNLGNRTRLAPIPKPAPPRALAAIVGTNTSNTANVAAAERAIITISSTFNLALGIANAAIATIIPSTKYLIARFRNSLN